MTSFLLLKEAVKKVPSLKFLFGLIGITAGIAIMKTINLGNYEIPVKSILTIIVLMVLLYIFSNLANAKDKHFRIAGRILTYVTTAIFSIVLILFTTSVFIDFPKPITEYYFFKVDSTHQIINDKKDTISIDESKNNNLITPHKNIKNTQAENRLNDDNKKLKNKYQINKEHIEISIQLSNTSSGYLSITVDNMDATILASSTPNNPRIFVTDDSLRMQIVRIITSNEDTCVLKRLFDKKSIKNIIRFSPDYCNKK
jgi:hypothetical protein